MFDEVYFIAICIQFTHYAKQHAGKEEPTIGKLELRDQTIGMHYPLMTEGNIDQSLRHIQVGQRTVMRC